MLLLVIFYICNNNFKILQRFSSLVLIKVLFLLQRKRFKEIWMFGENCYHQVCGDKFCNNGEKLAFMNDRLRLNRRTNVYIGCVWREAISITQKK